MRSTRGSLPISWPPTARAGGARFSTSAPGRRGFRSRWPRPTNRARVLALDLSETMLAQAGGTSPPPGWRRGSERTTATPNPWSTRSATGVFEGVISNTIVHHIPDPEPALATMARLVAPAGTLVVRDLVRPQSVAEVQRLVETYAAGESGARSRPVRSIASRRLDSRRNTRPRRPGWDMHRVTST